MFVGDQIITSFSRTNQVEVYEIICRQLSKALNQRHRCLSRRPILSEVGKLRKLNAMQFDITNTNATTNMVTMLVIKA